jgi:hypothetical protein
MVSPAAWRSAISCAAQRRARTCGTVPLALERSISSLTPLPISLAIAADSLGEGLASVLGGEHLGEKLNPASMRYLLMMALQRREPVMAELAQWRAAAGVGINNGQVGFFWPWLT